MKDNFLFALLAAGAALAAYYTFGQQSRASVQKLASPYTNLGTARATPQGYRPSGLVPSTANNGLQAAAASQTGIPWAQLVSAVGSVAQTAISGWRNRERIGTPTGIDDWHRGLDERSAVILSGNGTGWADNPRAWLDTPADTGTIDDFWGDPSTGGFGAFDGEAVV